MNYDLYIFAVRSALNTAAPLFCQKIDGYVNTHAKQSKIASGFYQLDYPAHSKRNEQNGGKDINGSVRRALAVFEQQQTFQRRSAVHRLDGQEIENAYPRAQRREIQGGGIFFRRAESESRKFAAGPAKAQSASRR